MFCEQTQILGLRLQNVFLCLTTDVPIRSIGIRGTLRSPWGHQTSHRLLPWGLRLEPLRLTLCYDTPNDPIHPENVQIDGLVILLSTTMCQTMNLLFDQAV